MKLPLTLYICSNVAFNVFTMVIARINASKFSYTLRKKYSELFWPDFPAFGLNTERYGVPLQMRENVDQKTSNMDIFHAVTVK